MDISQSRPQYVTWDGLEPDKWASVWLIKRHIAPDAEVIIKPVGAPVGDGIPFGTPEAQFRREHGASLYANLLQSYGSDDRALQQLSEIIQDIEITPWTDDKHQDSAIIEQAFRRLQEQFDGRDVPIACYGEFFDRVYEGLLREHDGREWPAVLGSIEKDSCGTSAKSIAQRDTAPFVREVDATAVLDLIGAGRRVVFVDAREPAEFDDYHIPGAVNLRIRDVSSDVKARFDGADLVIGYCIKDFRGFELARALSGVGVKNTAIMNPYGIAGWRHLGLPTTGLNGLSEDAALAQLHDCATGTRRCL